VQNAERPGKATTKPPQSLLITNRLRPQSAPPEGRITRAAFSTCGGAQTNVLSVHQRTVGDGGPGGITNCIDGEN
jgi:hypothetical protein